MPDGYRADPAGSLALTYTLDTAPAASVLLRGETELDITSTFTLGAGKGWRTARIPLVCIGDEKISELVLQAGEDFVLSVAQIAISPESFQASCDGPF